MSLFSHEGLDSLVRNYGYLAVALGVGLESMGLPIPGETILVVAAVYAATHTGLNIWLIVVTASMGAIIGDNLGYWLGSRFGYPLLLRFGPRVGLSEGRIKVGQYLFLRHGSKVVFLGRFVALLRIIAAFLAGVNRMEWRGSWSRTRSEASHGRPYLGSAVIHLARLPFVCRVCWDRSCLSLPPLCSSGVGS